jgi:hypothetical protein
MATLKPLQIETSEAFYDDALRLVVVKYRGVVNSMVTAAVYGWVLELVANVPIETSRGSIYDFREATHFDNTNLRTVQRSSKKINVQVDVSNHPVALLVSNMLQEQMVRVSMKITPQEERKRIVKSEQDALAFINDWNEKHNAKFDLTAQQLAEWPVSAHT